MKNCDEFNWRFEQSHNEEARAHLAAVGVWPCVGHGKKARRIVLELEVFVCKLFTVDALAAGSVVVGEVTPLKHEPWDNAVKTRSFVAEAFLFRAQEPEVARSFWHNVVKKFEDNSASRLAPDGDFEENI
jgi:hypothetical protein